MIFFFGNSSRFYSIVYIGKVAQVDLSAFDSNPRCPLFSIIEPIYALDAALAILVRSLNQCRLTCAVNAICFFMIASSSVAFLDTLSSAAGIYTAAQLTAGQIYSLATGTTALP